MGRVATAFRRSLFAVLVVAVLLAWTATAQVGDGPGQDVDTGGLTDGLFDFLFDEIITVGGLEITGLHAVVTAVGLGFLALAGFLGVKHVTPENALDNESRAALYETIRSEPGVHLRELARNQDMNITAASWHLKKLEDVGLIRSKKLEGYKVFYSREGGKEAQRQSVATNALRNDNARGLLEEVAADPGSHQRALADELDLNHATVRWHLQKLEEAGLVRIVNDGYRSKCFITAEGMHALDTVSQVAS